jgi:hypothetical protein
MNSCSNAAPARAGKGLVWSILAYTQMVNFAQKRETFPAKNPAIDEQSNTDLASHTRYFYESHTVSVFPPDPAR